MACPGRRGDEVYERHTETRYSPREQDRAIAAALRGPPERQRSEGCADDRDDEGQAADFAKVFPPEIVRPGGHVGRLEAPQGYPKRPRIEGGPGSKPRQPVPEGRHLPWRTWEAPGPGVAGI